MFKHILTTAAVTLTLLSAVPLQALANSVLSQSGPLSGGVSVEQIGSQAQIIPCLPQLNRFGLRCACQSKSVIPAQVTDVAPMSQAYRSGLQTGDVILAMQNGKEDYSLTIKRSGKLYAVTLRGGVDRHPFPELEIAELRHEGVLQQANPNCWFEAGLSALADSPDGPRAIANMISAAPYGYVVKFPGVEAAVPVSEALLANSPVADRAKWACVLECAEIQVYPDNSPARGATTGNPGVKVGLEMLTGRPVNFVRPETLSEGDLGNLFTRLRAAGKPVTLASKSPGEHGQDIQPLTPNHAYSVVDFDTVTGMLTLRNPYGMERRSGEGIVEHVSTDEIRVDLPTVRTFFRFVAYPS